MSSRRMMSKQIVDADDFLDMPLSAQALYLHLLVRADDDGFTNGVKKVMRMIGARDDDLKVLLGKRFVLMFDSGVLVIKHWLIHNSIRKDRYKPTTHQEEMLQLGIKSNNAYTLKNEKKQLENGSNSEWQPNGNQLAPQVSIGKVSIGKDNKEELSCNVTDNVTIYQEVIKYLNDKIGSSYKYTSKATQRLIKARVADGYGLDDFSKVINIKCDEWNNTDMAKYLRPQTLFGTKFESYLNQKQSNQPTNNTRFNDIFGSDE